MQALYVSAGTRARECIILTIDQMGTADAEILSTQRFRTLRDDVHLEDFMYLIIIHSRARQQ